MALVIDPQYAKLIEETNGTSGGGITDTTAIRNWANASVSAAAQAVPWPEGMQQSTHSASSALEIQRFAPQAHDPGRAVVFVFGGGMISGSVESSRGFVAALAHTSRSQVFAPQYRIAPEHPFPAAVDDALAAVEWLQANAQAFGVDPARIVVFGQSAGGGVAAGMALRARDRGLSPPLAGQCLRYPMLDDRTTMADSDPRWKYWTWSVAANDMGWKCYLGGLEKWERTDENISCYAAPARAKELHGLPPTFIGVGSLDLFKDENLDYAARLVKADVGVEFHLYPGMPHGFDGPHGFAGVPPMKLGKEMWEDEARWIMKF
ncbi:alpha/beta hydrolase fold-domain-containing protein [Jackrogersella minutella]|nr:alpha/beta hydrolase fold-domain-containing protein [Jackrogersella minutella]